MNPRKPAHSLPSYDEPTPETRRHFSREVEAERALTRTEFTTGAQGILITLFLLTIVSVSVVQLYVGPRPKLNPSSFFHTGEIKSFERQLELESVVSQWLLPPVQSFLTGKLRVGNEQVYLGRDGWLFYRPDVDYVTGPPFLAPAQLHRRAHLARIQPDPLKAIVQFRDQLAARGIDLILLPAPTKASLAGDRLNERIPPDALLQNPSFENFKARLAARGVRVFDPAPLLQERKASAPTEPLYLKTDTHWRPEAMMFVAQKLAESLALPWIGTEAAAVTEKQIHSLGDIARMLKLPAEKPLYPPEEVTIHQVTVGNGLWRSNPDADVLLLGDSFANIFSLDALGWGESAGFAEQLSRALGGRPLDCILRNSDGAFATREMLARELARGRDRLAKKKLVIWEFSARELAFGDWKLLDLKLGQPMPSHFFSLPPSGEAEITGTVEAISSIPRPGTVPYRDHIVAVHLSEITIANHPPGEPIDAIVYFFSMRDNLWTPAARLRPGDRVRARVRSWNDVAGDYEQINRSELDDPRLQLEEPVWGELEP